MRREELCESLRKEFDIAHYRHAMLDRCRDCRRAPVDAGADRNHVGAAQAVLAEFSAFHRDAGQIVREGQSVRRIGPRIGNRHSRTVPLEPARHRHARVTESEHDHPLSVQIQHPYAKRGGR